MRHTSATLAACAACMVAVASAAALAVLQAVLQARGAPPQGHGSLGLFTFAVSAFRGPVR